MQPCVTVSRGGKASTPHWEIVGCLGVSAAASLPGLASGHPCSLPARTRTRAPEGAAVAVCGMWGGFWCGGVTSCEQQIRRECAMI